MKTIIFVIFMLSLSIAQAQITSLNDKEVSKLRKSVKSDPNAALVFREWQTLADQSLTEKPNPIDTIISEGHLISHPKKQLTIKSFADMRKIYALAISYRLTKNRAYLYKTLDFLRAWATINQPIGNPINDTKLELVIEAYDLIKKDVPIADQKKIVTWFSKIADQEMETFQGRYNNWNSHRIKIITAIAYTLNDARYATFAHKHMVDQIVNNLYADSTSLDFKHRDALHYHTYTLEPLLKAALILKRATGENFFTYVSRSGSSIKKSVDFLAVYAKGEKKHAEFVNSNVQIDRDRAAQKEPGFAIGSYFLVVKAIDVFAYSTYFDPVYAPVYQLLAKEKSLSESGPLIIELKPYSQWIPILNQVR